MKKWLCCMLLIALSAAIFLPAVLAATEVKLIVDGEKVAFPDESPYVDRTSHRTMVPARFVSEMLGADMTWERKLKQLTVLYQDKTILFIAGENAAQVNGKSVLLDTPAVIKNNRMMLPLRSMGEIFQVQVEWIGKRDPVIITTSPKIPKGTWIWDSSIIEQEQEEILSFASKHDVNAIYLHINRDLAPKVYQDFVRSAKEKQISVEALAGRPEWGLKANQEPIQKFMDWVLQYNASATSNERFDGFHFDIEPYLLAEWKTNPTTVLEQWIHNLRFIEAEAKGSGLKITLDVPYWLNNFKVPGTSYSLSAWMLEKFDGLVIMNYRNHALGKNGIIDNAKAMLREATLLNKQVIVAVETAKNTESDRTSFYSKSVDFMEQELQTAHQHFSPYASYAGMAIHDYKSWSMMVGRLTH
ncbi:copper amine oxidase N-terminal domain-containing protein [Paenibacillaceae bacterium]|nr:copper amine oxidase N-terminal domain-containing protein [Paenibacillaceae bacterium]